MNDFSVWMVKWVGSLLFGWVFFTAFWIVGMWILNPPIDLKLCAFLGFFGGLMIMFMVNRKNA